MIVILMVFVLKINLVIVCTFTKEIHVVKQKVVIQILIKWYVKQQNTPISLVKDYYNWKFLLSSLDYYHFDVINYFFKSITFLL